MVAAAQCSARRILGQRSDPEPIGRLAESNQPHVLPLGPDNSGSEITEPSSSRSYVEPWRLDLRLRSFAYGQQLHLPQSERHPLPLSSSGCHGREPTQSVVEP